MEPFRLFIRAGFTSVVFGEITDRMHITDLVTVDPETLGGTPVFKGTRVPVKTLFEYLGENYSLEEFLDCFPTVSREAAGALLARSREALLAAK